MVASLGLTGVAGADVGSRDINAMQDFAQRMLETARTGSANSWSNSNTGATGVLRILATDDRPGRPPCRTYEWTITATDGDRLDGRGQGCRVSGGAWALDETLRRRANRTAKKTPKAPAAPKAAESASATSSSKTAEEAKAAVEEKAAKDPMADLVITVPPRTFDTAASESQAK